jgi:hypothetical protein
MRGSFSSSLHSHDFRSTTGDFANPETNTPASGYINNDKKAAWEISNVSSCLVYCASTTPGDMCTILAKVNF